jgi:ABC-2 type transport system permease protein
LAGTGVQRYKHFLRVAAEFHSKWQGHIQPLMLRSVRLGTDDVDQLPTWTFRDEPTNQVLGRVWSNASGLVLLAAAIVALGITVVSRYRVAG